VSIGRRDRLLNVVPAEIPGLEGRPLVALGRPTYVRLMQRRTFLSASAATAGAALLAGVSGCGNTPRYTTEALGTPALLASMGHDRIVRIGRVYLEMTPAERTSEALRDGILDIATPWPWNPVPPLDALVAADFEQNRTVFVDGWMLSAAEARQCALYALAHS
jgi:hypothetical protein